MWQQRAIDLDMDGFIIESHIDPDNAWSDAKQQVTPERLKEMLDHLVWRKEDVSSEEYHAALEKLRQQINHLDDELMQILSQRMKLAEKIGEYKKIITSPFCKPIAGMRSWKEHLAKGDNLD
jgi:chorismate mutase